MGWFVTDRIELYGEATLFLYDRPQTAVAVGLGGLSGRYYLKTSGGWLPYVHAGSGLLWTSLDVPEIDRILNFQLFMGVGCPIGMGWFVTDRIELYGEATLFLYDRPQTAVAVGLGGLSGRYYLKTSGGWLPYVHAGSGLLWTSLDVPEIDRILNFQLFMGVGW